MLPKYLKYYTFSSCFWSIIIFTGNCCLEICCFVFSTFISIPYYLPISIILSVMSCNTVSSLASNTRLSAYSRVWMIYLPSYFEVSKPIQSFLGKAFAVQVEQNWWQTASLSNSSSNLHTSSLLSVQSYINSLSHVQVANQSSFTPVNTSSL